MDHVVNISRLLQKEIEKSYLLLHIVIVNTDYYSFEEVSATFKQINRLQKFEITSWEYIWIILSKIAYVQIFKLLFKCYVHIKIVYSKWIPLNILSEIYVDNTRVSQIFCNNLIIRGTIR